MTVLTDRMHPRRDQMAKASFRASATILRGSPDEQTSARTFTPNRYAPPIRNTPELTVQEARELEEDDFFVYRNGSWAEPTQLERI